MKLSLQKIQLHPYGNKYIVKLKNYAMAIIKCQSKLNYGIIEILVSIFI